MKDTPEDKRAPLLLRIYDRIVLGFWPVIVVLVLAITGFFITQLKYFKMDASSDSIVLENDTDLRYYDETRQVFGSDDYVVITVTPEQELFSQPTLERLAQMIERLSGVPSVESITSILSVPLFHSPDIPLFQLASDYRTLSMEETPLDLAKQELVESPLYRDYLISTDGRTSAVQVNFDSDERLDRLENERYRLTDKQREGTLSPEEERELQQVREAYSQRHAELSAERKENVEQIRAIMAEFRGPERLGELHLGGVPMIIVDIINYVQRDIVVFLIGVLICVFIMMGIFFRKPKWILLPTLSCLGAVLIMMGYLGFADWQTTIVTSNFSSLLLIVTMAIAIHIVVHYQEEYALHPEASNRELALRTVQFVWKPCLFTTVTTMVGFGSLVVSGIRPVIDFGQMMIMGLSIAYLTCFVFMPSALMMFPKGKVPAHPHTADNPSPLQVFAKITERFRGTIAIVTLLLVALCLVGISRLTVENRFIDYFKPTTPIHRGMTVIDNRLGGTTPLEVVLDGNEEDYWLQPENLETLAEIHTWIDELPETGKVISPHTMLEVLKKINNDKPVSTAILNLMRTRLPEEIARAVLRPYVTPDFSTVRIAMRVRESDRGLQRKALMEKMSSYLENESGMPPGTTHITGMFVLYNNMLQSLFRSQILTIGAVIASIWLVFFLLFRSPSWATIAIIPNVIPVILVLGTLGWLGIPLDMMTIMIAAITFGIAVDDTIHFIHRFQKEFPKDRNYIKAMYRCHSSIGYAIVYTSITIVVGFSILVFSNFIPTIYFGIFTGLAMIIALLAALLLLPLLIITWKPMGPNVASDAEGRDVTPEQQSEAA